MQPCINFIQGFLAAAQAIDPPVINQQSKNDLKFYGAMSRLYRNRYQTPATRFFPFCIHGIVSKQLSPQTDTAKMLRDTIFNALKVEYPCGKIN
ncbi:MAG: hypothetical protein ABUK13_02450 [Gammaproteobacteria bacterium]